MQQKTISIANLGEQLVYQHGSSLVFHSLKVSLTHP